MVVTKFILLEEPCPLLIVDVNCTVAALVDTSGVVIYTPQLSI